jgi:ribonuclease P/MRP protein subunit RPP40
MELGKEIYERTGLTGKPFRSGGRKHAKERFCVYNQSNWAGGIFANHVVSDRIELTATLDAAWQKGV